MKALISLMVGTFVGSSTAASVDLVDAGGTTCTLTTKVLDGKTVLESSCEILSPNIIALKEEVKALNSQLSSQVCEPAVSLITGGSIYDSSTVHGGHSTDSQNPLAAWADQMILWANPNTYDVEYRITFPSVVDVSSLSVTYDAGATIKLLSDKGYQIGATDCYASNGNNVQTCDLVFPKFTGQSFRMIVDSKHGTWNWMGKHSLGCSKIPDACADFQIDILNDGTKHSLSTNYGGHVGDSLDALDAWKGKMIMWQSPNTYDVQYKITYAKPVKITGLRVTYDAGATVKLLSGDGNTVLASTGCYASNGNTVNTCLIGPVDATASSFRVIIDSSHGTWNWMGEHMLLCSA